MATPDKKDIEYHLTGPSKGGPSFDDIMKLFTALTGREPTPNEIIEARDAYDNPEDDATT